MKVSKFIVLLFVLLMLSTCDYYQGFRFDNNFPRDVYIYLDAYGRESGGIVYPDTATPRGRVGSLVKLETGYPYWYSTTKEPAWVDTLSIFIFDADTINMYSWEEIRKGYKILQRYDISPEDIKA